MIEIVECKGSVDEVAMKEYVASEDKASVVEKYKNYTVGSLLANSYKLLQLTKKLREPYKRIVISKN